MLCKKGNAEAKALNERLQRAAARTPSTSERLDVAAEFLEDGYEVQRTRVAEFGAIEPPPQDAEVIEKLQTAHTEQTVLVGRLLDAAKADDPARLRSLTQELERVVIRARGLAQGYGFEECGSGKSDAD